MRRSGRTTRMVDHAIQMLFEEGFIQVPVGVSSYARRTRRYTKNIIVDPAGTEDESVFDSAQRELQERIMLRLRSEHPHLKVELKRSIISINKNEV